MGIGVSDESIGLAGLAHAFLQTSPRVTEGSPGFVSSMLGTESCWNVEHLAVEICCISGFGTS